MWLLCWLCGTVRRTSVLAGVRSLSYTWNTAHQLTTYVGKPSAIGQPTRPTQPYYKAESA